MLGEMMLVFFIFFIKADETWGVEFFWVLELLPLVANLGTLILLCNIDGRHSQTLMH